MDLIKFIEFFPQIFVLIEWILFTRKKDLLKVPKSYSRLNIFWDNLYVSFNPRQRI